MIVSTVAFEDTWFRVPSNFSLEILRFEVFRLCGGDRYFFVDKNLSTLNVMTDLS